MNGRELSGFFFSLSFFFQIRVETPSVMGGKPIPKRENVRHVSFLNPAPPLSTVLQLRQLPNYFVVERTGYGIHEPHVSEFNCNKCTGRNSS